MGMILYLGLALLFVSVVLLLAYIIPEQKKKEGIEIKGRQDALIGLLYPWIKYLAKKNKGLNMDTYRQKIEKKMVSAGNPEDLTPDEFLGFKEVMFLCGLIFPVLILLFFQKFNSLLFLIPVISFFYPDMWLNDKLKARQKKILRALPDALDLLTLCVEAGLDFASGLGKVIEKSQFGPLIEEFSHTLQEIRMGKTRAQSLKDMSGRVNIEELSSFVSVIVQADQLGTSIGPILRVQADQMRVNRFLRAEKLAMEAPVKMLLPLLGCIFPAVFIMLFGPIAIKIMGMGF